MNSYIIDTNVLVVANDKYDKAGFEDVFECQRFLIDIQKNEKRLSVDSLGLIFNEYFNHARMAGQPGIGDAFVKWLWDNQGYESICEQVEITPDTDGTRGFLEFPGEKSLENFDWSDRKFVAVAVSSKFDALICNASDSDWWIFKKPLEKVGVKIKFLCPELVKKTLYIK
ncbi:MAG: hypothetical protein NT166_19795 [Candidatus Aminicenantes bacterium]|nr:hypothetical protein [Candidatus Aminicenantes bacterium]